MRTLSTILTLGAAFIFTSTAIAGLQTAEGRGTATAKEELTRPSIRETARVEKFTRMLGTGGSQPGNRPQVSLAGVFYAYAKVTEGFDYTGRGDAEYWMKSARDLGRSGRALGRSLQELSYSLPSGPLAAAIAGLGAQLNTLDWSGSGDAHFWMARAREIGVRVQSIGAQLRAMGNASSQGNAGQVNLAVALRGLAEVSNSVDYAGTGDAYYWMRTTRNFVLIGRALGAALKSFAPEGSDPLAIVLAGTVAQYAALSEAGTGDANYWMARARGVAEQMKALGYSLNDIASNL